MKKTKVFDTFWGKWKEYEATLGGVLNTHVQGLVFKTQVRNHDTSVSRALFDDAMPETVVSHLDQRG
ncbi:hypothetical protein [Saccharobesus litoralis]|uniref:hypothetical protein n=1 Tax=Saccharobesus litoralis TaxID=2172099 RepID=UPI001E3D60F2|nr:hypothetical protein [Saccharobesus litoralis]